MRIPVCHKHLESLSTRVNHNLLDRTILLICPGWGFKPQARLLGGCSNGGSNQGTLHSRCILTTCKCRGRVGHRSRVARPCISQCRHRVASGYPAAMFSFLCGLILARQAIESTGLQQVLLSSALPCAGLNDCRICWAPQCDLKHIFFLSYHFEVHVTAPIQQIRLMSVCADTKWVQVCSWTCMHPPLY